MTVPRFGFFFQDPRIRVNLGDKNTVSPLSEKIKSTKFLISVFKHYPVNVVVPMHLSHYDIIVSILSKSKIGREMYIYDNADIILSEFMFSRWDSALKNQTEYNRLKNGGITKVGNVTRVSRTVRIRRVLT